MYMMVLIDFSVFADITDDLDFCKKFFNEQCCLVFPSLGFFAKDFFRIVSFNSDKI